MQKGPKAIFDEEAEVSYLVCHGCDFFRIVESHYFFCAAQGTAKSYLLNEVAVQLNSYVPSQTCPYKEV